MCVEKFYKYIYKLLKLTMKKKTEMINLFCLRKILLQDQEVVIKIEKTAGNLCVL